MPIYRGTARLKLFKPVVSTGTPFSITWTDSVGSAVAGTSFSFATRSIGTADATRVLYIGVGFGLNTVSPTAVTIDFGLGGGAQAMSLVAGSNVNSAAGAILSIYTIAAPSGTTGTVALTWASNTDRCTISIYSVVGTGQSAGTAAVNHSASGVTTLTQAATIPVGGGAIAFTYIHVAAGGVATPTNLTNDNSLPSIGTSTMYSGHNSAASGSTTMGESWTSAGDVSISIIPINP